MIDFEDNQDRYLLEGEEYEHEFERSTTPEVVGSQNGSASVSQLALIYSLYLAEAIVAASLQPQLTALMRNEKLCSSVDSVYWSGIVEGVFAFGSVAGLFWGWLGDKLGRRPVALIGMIGLAASCFAMGFTTGVLSMALVRGFAGLMASSMKVTVWTMLGDVSDTTRAKLRNFAFMPLVAMGGVIGPLLQASLANRFSDTEIWNKYPILSSQLVCAAMMVVLFAANVAFLDETLPENTNHSTMVSYKGKPYRDLYSSESVHEKTGFLSSENDYDQHSEKPKPLSFTTAIRAPSLLILLTSFSFLTIHSSIYDTLLPLLATTMTEEGGIDLSCTFMLVGTLTATLLAAVITCTLLPRAATSRLGVLGLYRLTTWAFPMILVLTPLMFMITTSDTSTARATSTAIVAYLSLALKSMTTTFSQTLVIILVTNASPDAFSLGSIMGLLHSTNAVRGFAVAGTAIAWLMAPGTLGTRIALWVSCLIVALGGAGLAWFVKERARVNRDWMSGVLKWEVCYENFEDEDSDGSSNCGSDLDSDASSIEV